MTWAELVKVPALSVASKMAIFADVFVWVTDHPGVLVAAFSLYVFIYVVSVFFSGPKPGPNPLKKDTSRPPKPLVTDQAERDKVIKCGMYAYLDICSRVSSS